MAYGLKIYSATGESKIITPDDATVIAAGSLTMSNTLEGDNTYGEDIALGATYDVDEISVLVMPRRPSYQTTYNRYIDTTLYYNTFYLDSAETYYTRNTSTGVMTSFSAGNKTVNSKSTWNPVLSVFPIAFWDKKGATTFSSVRLFAGTVYLIRDLDNDVNFSLAGTASGSGGGFGVPANIKDNNINTWYGKGCWVNMGNSCSYSYSCQVTFASATIHKVEVDQEEYAMIVGGTYANGNWALRLYYGGAWNTVANGTWVNPVNLPNVVRSAVGLWKGVTGIRMEAGGSAQAGGFGQEALSEHATNELRAWGTRDSDADVNKIVYSIGNKGVSTVDYMICRKKFV